MNMIALPEYLSSLQRRGVRLWVDNGQLHYHAAKGALNADELARLRVMRDDIVTELTRPPVATSAGSTVVPLSFQQEWLLMLILRHEAWQQFQTFAFQLEGLLDVRVLERSIDILFQRHDSLRARVVGTQRGHGLEIDTPRPYRLDVVPVDVGFVARAEHNIRLQISDVVSRFVNAFSGPLLHVRLLRISEQRHYLILIAHRLVADCLALAQLFRELWLLYGEAIKVQSSSVEPEPGQYQNYVIWQHATAEQWQHKHYTYWEDHLANAPRLRWPVSAAAPPGVAETSGSTELVSLQATFGRPLSAGLRDLARQTQTLPALVLLTLYASVVSRCCGQQDFVLPFNVAGRHATHESVVGCFAQVVYLHLTVKAEEPFEELLRRVSNVFYKAVFHQDYGRMVLKRPDLLGGTLCQYISWHPAELAGRDMYEIPARLGVVTTPVRFQSARQLTSVPPGATDVDTCFFESTDEIAVLLISQRNRLAPGTLEWVVQQLQSSAQQIIDSSHWSKGGTASCDGYVKQK